MLRRVGLWLSAAATAIVAVLLALGRAERRGEHNAKAEADADTLERTEAGRAAVRDGRASGATPTERVHDNDGHW